MKWGVWYLNTAGQSRTCSGAPHEFRRTDGPKWGAGFYRLISTKSPLLKELWALLIIGTSIYHRGAGLIKSEFYKAIIQTTSKSKHRHCCSTPQHWCTNVTLFLHLMPPKANHSCLFWKKPQRNDLTGHKSTEFYFSLLPLLNIHSGNGWSVIKLLRFMEAQSH